MSGKTKAELEALLEEANKKLNSAENWYRSKKYWVQVAGLLAFGIFIGWLFF